jgi:hypothetical protein
MYRKAVVADAGFRRDIAEYIRAKYVEGRWLSDEGRRVVGLRPLSPGIGRAT